MKRALLLILMAGLVSSAQGHIHGRGIATPPVSGDLLTDDAGSPLTDDAANPLRADP